MTGTIILIGFGVSIFYFTRSLLEVSGLLKDPIIRSFQKYGDEEEFYFLLPRFLFWSGLFLLTSSFVMSVWVGVVLFPGQLFGVLLMGAAFVLHAQRDYFQTHPNRLLIYPRWFYDLHERTSRLERRRIAYMWLRMSGKARLNLNSNNRAFNEWADMIILSTLM